MTPIGNRDTAAALPTVGPTSPRHLCGRRGCRYSSHVSKTAFTFSGDVSMPHSHCAMAPPSPRSSAAHARRSSWYFAAGTRSLSCVDPAMSLDRMTRTAWPDAREFAHRAAVVVGDLSRRRVCVSH